MSTPFNSDFALLDVKRGRKALAARILKGEAIPVTLVGEITGVYGGDDGTSIEFIVNIHSVTESTS